MGVGIDCNNLLRPMTASNFNFAVTTLNLLHYFQTLRRGAAVRPLLRSLGNELIEKLPALRACHRSRRRTPEFATLLKVMRVLQLKFYCCRQKLRRSFSLRDLN